ncbi:MAG: amidohydrolase family protein, partial [Pseudomonadota bacterium]
PASAFGGVGMESLLSAALSLHQSGTMDLHKALGLVTYKPADLLRVEAGRIAVGHPADLALIDIDRGWKVSESSLRSKSKNSPFDGLPMTGRAVRTLVDGRTVYTA